ncbi:MAG: hypothetical protein UR54_C0032G0003 [Candidatus Roizmanbacteria bacterium GW2011_GWA2_34_18]|uniref:FAD-binding domain-containing protein n=1 Tax=Candidatus Roizmanbacteria bacterium GW2011_GWA2_34_18 TaxID=1618477 RepID=A0A0G0DVJ1_9BACT|nr:MAG: hypothetical protein UR54_C0032G0003 [Candidatus Roizmanbacteria bacterium GW2011_GWA2_34_18]
MTERSKLRSPEIDIHDREIAIVGGGPAGALTAILLKEKGFKNVTIYESRLPRRGKRITQCTGCAGIIQPEVVELLKNHGLTVPDDVIQARLTKESQIHLPGNRNLTVKQKKGTIAVYRGFAPVNQQGDKPKTESFDAWLLKEAIKLEVKHREVEVTEIDLRRDRQKKVTVTFINEKKEIEKKGIDIVIGAYGHNGLKDNIVYPDQAVRLDQPTVSQSAVKEFLIGGEAVERLLHNSMHIFGNPTDKIWFAMIVPKGDFVTVSIMGRGDVNEDDMDKFLKSEAVKNLLGDLPENSNCQCSPIFTTESPRNYMVLDEDGNISQVNVGDAGPTRPMKNGIGAAMDSAEKLVETIEHYGIGNEAARRYKKYIDMTYVWDNLWAKVVLKMTDHVLGRPLLLNQIDRLLKHKVPVLTKLVNSIIDNIISGRKPYWQIPVMAAKDLFE